MKKIIQILTEKFHPESIFLYWSRARNDFLPESDFEIGVMFREEDYVSRSEIRKVVTDSNFSIYPFRSEEVKNTTLDTPFQKTLYIWDIGMSGKTIWGEPIVENLILPEIRLLDLVQDVRFCLGCATSAHISFRSGDLKTASNLFYRSCLYWARDYLIFQWKGFVSGYENIFELSQSVDFWEYSDLIETAYEIRIGKKNIDATVLFANIKFLNKFVETPMIEVLNSKGNIVLIS